MKTVAELTRACLGEARQQLIKTGGVSGLIMVRDARNRLRRLDLPEELGGMLNHGGMKDILFGTLRELVRTQRFNAFIMAVEAWLGVATEAGMKLNTENPAEYERLSCRGVIEMERLGLATRSEVIHCMGQTPDSNIVIYQPFERGPEGITFGPETVMEGAANFEGRMKMF